MEDKGGDTEKTKHKVEDIGLYQARSALIKNIELLADDKDLVMWNLNVVLLYMLGTMEHIKHDIDRLQIKLQSLLKKHQGDEDRISR